MYEAYFERPRAVYIGETGNGEITLTNTESRRRHSEETGEKPNFHPDLPDLQVLRICRQVHQEAASILYSNEFCLDSPETFPRLHDSTGHCVNHSSTAWLRQIGQHKFFLRKLVIDISSTCSLGCVDTEKARLSTFRPNDGYHQFGALLQSIWASDLKMMVSFVKTLQLSGHRCSLRPSTQRRARSSAASNVERLTATFQALAKDDLDMKRFRRAIGDIGIKADGTVGVFAFWTPAWRDTNNHAYATIDHERNPLLEHARYFTARPGEKLAFDKNDLTGLLDLPKVVLNKIVEHTVCQELAHELDLDSFTDMKDLYGIIYANRWLHDQYMNLFLSSNTFNLSVMSSNARATFDYSKLDRLLRTQFRYVSNKGPGHILFGAAAGYSINLHVHFGTSVLVSSLKNIRVNVVPFIAATFGARGDRIWKIYLHNGTSILQGRVSTIRKLRHEVIAMLSKFVKKDHIDDVHVRCPEIWINGHGKVVNIVQTGSDEGKNVLNPAKMNSVLWSADKTGSYVGARTPEVAKLDGPARNMYLYLKWIDK